MGGEGKRVRTRSGEWSPQNSGDVRIEVEPGGDWGSPQSGFWGHNVRRQV